MQQQKIGRNFLHFECLVPQNLSIIKALKSLDSSISNGRLSQNPKKGHFRELFLPKNDFKTCSAVDFPKKTSRSLRPRNQPDMKLRLEFFSHALLYMNSL